MDKRISQRLHSTQPSSQEERPRAPRERQILDAAFKEFAVNGFEAARLEDVARRAGIAKGTIYLYFKNKELLFRAVVRSLIHPVLGTFDAHAALSAESAEEVLRGLMSRHYTELVKNDKARAIFRLLIAESGKFPQLSEMYYRELKHGLGALRLVLERGAATGEFRRTRAVDFPQILMAPAGIATLWKLIFGERRTLDLDAYMRAHLEFVLLGIRKPRFRGTRTAVTNHAARQ
jgi:AcrR family transcriptional regulator